jgi:serine/threonine-protein kinase
MSPEQAAGEREIDGRSDLYSLGVVGYQMLTGSLPFEAPTVAGILLKQITATPASILDRRPDCPDDLASSVMRCLDKEPERRWPTAEALRRALEARSGGPYQPARPNVRRSAVAVPRPALVEPRAAPDADVGRGGRRTRRALGPETGEAVMVRRMRAAIVSWASVCSGLVVLDFATGWGGWSIWPLAMWGGFGILPRYLKLWNAGYSWRDVLQRPVAPDAAAARGIGAGAPRELAAGTSGEFGSFVASVNQARGDRQAILRIMDKLPKSERALLPDVVATADALLARAESLARTAQAMSVGVDDSAAVRIEWRIKATQAQPESAERDRQLSLLARQRQALTDLLARRRAIDEQNESCGLAMQNVRFDLLRLRSAGVAAVLGDLTQATQQAKALSRDVDNAIAAAGEIREAMRP